MCMHVLGFEPEILKSAVINSFDLKKSVLGNLAFMCSAKCWDTPEQAQT